MLKFDNSEQLEDWLDDRGYAQYGDNRLIDLETRVEGLESVLKHLLRHADVIERVLKYGIQGRIKGFEMNEHCMTIHLSGKPPEKGEQPSLFDRIIAAIETDSIDVDDPDKPWFN